MKSIGNKRFAFYALHFAFAVFAAAAHAALPGAYTAVEYIQSDGNQYIDTGVVPTTATRVVCDFRLTVMPSVRVRCGWASKGNKEAFWFGTDNGPTNFSASVCRDSVQANTGVPVDTNRQKVVKAMSLPGAHGVVWDARRGSLFALGYTNLYELAYSSADMSVSVKRSWDYSAKLCDQYGHDLVADGSGGYFLTNHTAVWHLDPDADRWTKVRDMANVKSFSRDAKKGDLLTIAKENWWTDELKIIEPDGTTRVVGPFPGARFYKARWM